MGSARDRCFGPGASRQSDTPATGLSVRVSIPSGPSRGLSIFQRVVKAVAATTGLAGHATCRTIHHFLRYLPVGGVRHRTIQELLGREDVRKTMIHTHSLNPGR